MGLLHIFIWFLWEDYLVKVWGHWPYFCRTNLNFYGPRSMKASVYSIQNHKMNLKTLNSRCLLKLYCEFAERNSWNSNKNSVWKPKKKIEKLSMVEMLIFCTIMIYLNDLRFKKRNFPKICWDILWFIKGHPLKCKKS